MGDIEENMPGGMHGERRHQVAQPADRITRARAAPSEESATSAHVDLIATKLLAPPPRAGVVARPRLLRRLDEALRCRLTLLSAPPGSGKTTLLAGWLDHQRRHARHLIAAWVGLDEGDDDPTRFWLVIAAALEHALPGSTGAAPALLRAPQPPPARAVLAALLNGLAAAPGTILLVLDDYHAIVGPSIHEALAYLIDHLPPHIHLVLTSRADPPLPLARLRARGELVELGANDLRFTADEAADFLSETMALRLGPEQMALLQTRTEGWIAGLQLAALSLRGQGDVSAFLESFAGSHRYIVDYLADEVLDRQPRDVRDFLLRTSPLDQLCGPLCDAVTGGHDGQERLTTLERANLFLIPLDHERRWFRYHALFAGALRERLRATRPDEIANLHARASAWFEGEGMLQAAVTHALAGGDKERAASLVERMAESLWKRSQVAALRALLDALPADVVRARPKLCLFHSWIGFIAGQFAAGRDWLDDAERAVAALDEHCPAVERDMLRGALLAIQATLARADGQYREAEALARRTLDLVGEDQTMWRSIAALNLVQVAWALGEPDAASEAIAEATRISERGGDDFGTVAALLAAGGMEEDFGHLHLAADLLRRGLRRYRERGPALPAMAGYLVAGLASITYEWNRLDDAERLARESIEIGRVGEVFDVLYNGLLTLARIHQARGDHAAAVSTIREAERLISDAHLPSLTLDVAAWEIDLRLAQGELDAAGAWARVNVGPPGGREETSLPNWGPPTLVPRVLLAMGRVDEAIERLQGMVDEAERAHQIRTLIKALAAQSLALRTAGKASEARVALVRALALGEPEGFVRSFADLGAPMADLLAAFAAAEHDLPISREYLAALVGACGRGAAPIASSTGTRTPDGLSDLSEREIEVLRLMAAGAANQAIADALVVSIHTVKTHVAHILAKLRVANRTEAVARARELHLV